MEGGTTLRDGVMLMYQEPMRRVSYAHGDRQAHAAGENGSRRSPLGTRMGQGGIDARYGLANRVDLLFQGGFLTHLPEQVPVLLCRLMTPNAHSE